jgi:hypothetical protein
VYVLRDVLGLSAKGNPKPYLVSLYIVSETYTSRNSGEAEIYALTNNTKNIVDYAEDLRQH